MSDTSEQSHYFRNDTHFKSDNGRFTKHGTEASSCLGPEV